MNDMPLRSIAVPRPIPIVLSFVAGYLDSCTYLGLFGVFVAQADGKLRPCRNANRQERAGRASETARHSGLSSSPAWQ